MIMTMIIMIVITISIMIVIVIRITTRSSNNDKTVMMKLPAGQGSPHLMIVFQCLIMFEMIV